MHMMFYVENPKREKPREPTSSKLSLCLEEYYRETQRQWTRVRSLRLVAITTKNHSVSVFLSISICVYLPLSPSVDRIRFSVVLPLSICKNSWKLLFSVEASLSVIFNFSFSLLSSLLSLFSFCDKKPQASSMYSRNSAPFLFLYYNLRWSLPLSLWSLCHCTGDLQYSSLFKRHQSLSEEDKNGSHLHRQNQQEQELDQMILDN